MRHVIKLALAGAAVLATLSSPAQAVVLNNPTAIATGSPNDCIGGFSTCYATQTGVVQGPVANDPTASPAVYKLNLNDNGSASTSETNTTLFSTVTGGEFTITLTDGVLNFTYLQGAGDPVLHYVDIKLANTYYLFYNAAAITGGSFTLSNYSRNGLSHITFFDTGSPAVPEPATWAMMLLGFGGIGMTMRRSRRRSGALSQVA